MTAAIPHAALLDPTCIQHPHGFYRDLHLHAPVWRASTDDIFVVSSYDLVEKATSRTEDISSNMRHLLYRGADGALARLPFNHEGTQVLATADPPVHTLHKRTAFPNFAMKRMALLEPEITETARGYVDAAVAQGEVEFMDAVANWIPIEVIGRLIGFRGEAPLKMLLQAALDSTDALAGTMSLEELAQLSARMDEVGRWVAAQLKIGCAEPEEDVLSAIGAGVKSGAISAAEGRVMLQTFLSAGGESTTSLIGNAARVLAENPELQAALRAAPERIPAFLEEVLRYESPFRSHMRSVTRDTDLGGVDLPEGATLLMFWGAANRDAAAFENPDALVLDRPRRHVGFGHGIHLCVGAPLARLEARVTIRLLLERTSAIELGEESPHWAHSIMVRRHEKLPLVLRAS
jgi:cytochrome P450